MELRQQSDTSAASPHQRLSMPNPPSLSTTETKPVSSHQHSRPNSVAIMGFIKESSTDSADLSPQRPHLFDMRLLADSLDSPSSRHSECESIEDAIHNLSSSLEDYRGHYPELHHLEEHIAQLKALVMVSPYFIVWGTTMFSYSRDRNFLNHASASWLPRL